MNIMEKRAATCAVILLLSIWLFGVIMTILILGILITLHEFGHWLMARRSGIEVPIFSVGFGRADQSRVLGRLWGTEFQLRPFPFGGFIAPDPESFALASFGARAATLAAGPLMNLFIPVVLFFFLFAFKGIPVDGGIKDVYVGGVSDTVLIAKQSGLKTGDIILSLNGEAIEKPEQVVRGLEERKLQAVTLVVSRDGKREIFDVVPGADGKIGIHVGVHLLQGSKDVGLLESAFHAVAETGAMVKKTLSMYGSLLHGKDLNQLSSIVGIVAVGSEQVNTGLVASVYFTAMLSIALAILNLLPLPGLDGGQLALLALEKMRGRPLSASVQGKLIFAVVVFFVGLTFYALYNDFVWLLGEFWAVPAEVISVCALFYVLLPVIQRLRAARS